MKFTNSKNIGPPKQRGRPPKIDQWDFHPSDHVPPAPQARTQQLEPRSQHPAPADEAADDPACCVTDAFDEAVSNQTVDNPSDTDTDMDEDFEFCTVGEDSLLTDALSRHHQRKCQKFVDFDNHKAGMLAEYAKLVTANLTGCICSVDGCETVASAHCEAHAGIHWNETLCHQILNASDQPLERNLRRLDCCKMSPVHSGNVAQLNTQGRSEQVVCHTCINHSISSMLMGLGIMVNRVAKPGLYDLNSHAKY
ncbi:hypothetical protein BJ741DRAFT_597130 [Chytriomyces cf. hyalinus JEL632]|nr:hypothetical protein BJ741DRAFT_597130 [Chytriomyces cf. hyalinus JEL632]